MLSHRESPQERQLLFDSLPPPLRQNNVPRNVATGEARTALQMRAEEGPPPRWADDKWHGVFRSEESPVEDVPLAPRDSPIVWGTKDAVLGRAADTEYVSFVSRPAQAGPGRGCAGNARTRCQPPRSHPRFGARGRFLSAASVIR